MSFVYIWDRILRRILDEVIKNKALVFSKNLWTGYSGCSGLPPIFSQYTIEHDDILWHS